MNELTLEKVERVHRDDTHNAFTDLCVFSGALYLAFRSCPDGHGVFPTSRIRIMKRALAGGEWQDVHAFSVPDRDTRDPHFLLFSDKLWVISGTWLCPQEADFSRRELNDHLGFCTWTPDGESWEGPTLMGGTHGHYVWRGAAQGEKAFLCGRRKLAFGPGDSSDGNTWPRVQSVLLSSDDGLQWKETGFFQETFGDETAFVVDEEGRITALCRFRDGERGAQLCRADPPYSAWTRATLHRNIGGPMLAKWGEQLIAGGRDPQAPGGPVTVLGWIEGEELVDVLDLPSGGDNSYPGFAALDDERAIVSYYSSHEEFRNAKGVWCSAIYLAEIRRG